MIKIYQQNFIPASKGLIKSAPSSLIPDGSFQETVNVRFGDGYVEKVKALRCLLGIQTHTALCLVVETGDFKRFAKGSIYAAYLGLAPGEHSSSTDINRLGISKAGNNHLRKLLIEAAGGICKGAIGHKSKALRAKQEGNTAEIIAYADKANTRMRSRYYHFIRRGKKRNIAVTAVARELACFIWGLMTNNIALNPT